VTFAGGVVATFPHEKDFLNPETGELLLKYTKRSPKMAVEDQAQFWRYLGDILCSSKGGIHNVGGYHGGGSRLWSRLPLPPNTISNPEKAGEVHRRHERR
jgi:aromatic ring hydroxylase